MFEKREFWNELRSDKFASMAKESARRQRIGNAMCCIGGAVHDHVIVGNGYCSMESSGCLSGMRKRIETLTNH